MICGWSAEYDIALKNALLGARARRFSAYWATKGEPGSAAKDLIAAKGIHNFEVTDSEEFFPKLTELVKSIDEYSQPHPLSTAVLVTTAKRYLAEDKYKIKLHDLIKNEFQLFIRQLEGSGASKLDSYNYELNKFSSCQKLLENETCSLATIASVCGFFGDDAQAAQFANMITWLVDKKRQSGIQTVTSLPAYPSVLIMYAFGCGALARGNYSLIGRLLNTSTVPGDNDKNISLGAKIYEIKSYLKLDACIYEYIKQRLSPILMAEEDAEYLIIKMEVILGLYNAYAKQTQISNIHNHANHGQKYSQIAREIKQSIQEQRNESVYIKNELVGAQTDPALKSVISLITFLNYDA